MLWILAQTPRRDYNPGNFRQICLLLLFFWRNLDSRRGRVAPHVLPTISVRHGTLVQKKIEKREADFKGEVSIHCFCSKLIKNDYVYGYVLKNWHNFTGMNVGCSKATTMATATRT